MDRLDAYPPRVKDTLNYLQVMFGGPTGNEKLYAFTPHQLPGSGFWVAGVAILGEPGFVLGPVTERFNEYAEVQEFIDQLHGALGYSPETAIAIIADTMARSELRTNAREGVVQVKLTEEQLEHAIAAIWEFDDRTHQSNVQEVLEAARDDLNETAEVGMATHR